MVSHNTLKLLSLPVFIAQRYLLELVFSVVFSFTLGAFLVAVDFCPIFLFVAVVCDLLAVEGCAGAAFLFP